MQSIIDFAANHRIISAVLIGLVYLSIGAHLAKANEYLVPKIIAKEKLSLLETLGACLICPNILTGISLMESKERMPWDGYHATREIYYVSVSIGWPFAMAAHFALCFLWWSVAFTYRLFWILIQKIILRPSEAVTAIGDRVRSRVKLRREVAEPKQRVMTTAQQIRALEAHIEEKNLELVALRERFAREHGSSGGFRVMDVATQAEREDEIERERQAEAEQQQASASIVA